MSMDDPDGRQTEWQKHCIVCGKTVLEGEGYCHMRVEDQMVALCCPLCFETFQKNPKQYLSLRRMRSQNPEK